METIELKKIYTTNMQMLEEEMNSNLIVIHGLMYFINEYFFNLSICK